MVRNLSVHVFVEVAPYSMAWSASDVGHSHISRSWTDGDAVVAGADDRVSNANMTCLPDVDAVGVEAISWRGYFKIVDVDVIALVKVHVEGLAIDEIKPVYRRIANIFKLECLHKTIHSS